MAGMLVALGIMAVFLSVAMPVWRHSARREKEEELIFRGTQYARAIGLYQRRFAAAYPPTVDVLIEQKFLRKKYKDPITGEDFQFLNTAELQTPGTQTPGAAIPGAPVPAGRGPIPVPAAGGRGGPIGGGVGGVTAPPGAGFVGVASKSKEESIRIYNGRTHYNEWTFVYSAPITTPGAQPGGRGGPQPPGRGGLPGQGPAFPPGQGPGLPGQGGQGAPPPVSPIPMPQPGRGR
jgi:type II secretory pathway pseudopilin PulG